MRTELGAAGTRLVLLATIAATVGCDRVTKIVATNTLAGAQGRSFLGDTVRLAYTENTGGFLSVGADLPPSVRAAVFTVGTGLMLLALLASVVRLRHSQWPAFGLALFVAGGASNWIDRAMRGSVVDFMNLGLGPMRTGIFNVADVAIMVGLGIFMIAELRHRT